MRINRRVDSAGAARWVKRAESLARSIRQKYQAKHEIQDGYLLEGKRAGNIRTARVVDIPGRFVAFGHDDIVIGFPGFEEDKRPVWVSAPVRAVMLEKPLEVGDDPREFVFERPDTDEATARFIGAPPPASFRSLGISAPNPSAGWVTQVRTIHPASDPVPPLDREYAPPYPYLDLGLTQDFSVVSNVWVMIDAWGVGHNGAFKMFIDEQIIQSLFGFPIIRKERSIYRGMADTRAWAAVVSPTKFAVTVLLADGIPAGQANSFGFFTCELYEGQWYISAYPLWHREMPHLLFQPHNRITPGGVQISPTMRSHLYPWVPSMATDEDKIYFLATLRHEMDGSYVSPARTVYAALVVTGLLRVELDWQSGGLDVELSKVNTAAASIYQGAPLAGNLTTTNGVVVSDHIDYGWGLSDWVTYANLFYQGGAMYEVVGFSCGIRGETTVSEGGFGGTTGGPHRYRDDADRFEVRKTEYTEEGPVVSDLAIEMPAHSMQPHTEPGSLMGPVWVGDYEPPIPGNVVDGGNKRLAPAFVGDSKFEMQVFRRGTNEWALARLDLGTGQVVEVPLPDGVTYPVPTCYAQEVVRDDDVTPARTVVSYWLGGQTTVEIRSGDEVVAIAQEVPDRYPFGVYYLGNPYTTARYGQMEGL